MLLQLPAFGDALRQPLGVHPRRRGGLYELPGGGAYGLEQLLHVGDQRDRYARRQSLPSPVQDPVQVPPSLERSPAESGRDLVRARGPRPRHHRRLSLGRFGTARRRWHRALQIRNEFQGAFHEPRQRHRPQRPDQLSGPGSQPPHRVARLCCRADGVPR